jgi:hypothetical protein
MSPEPSVNCPSCGRPNSAATHYRPSDGIEPPAEGDVSICWGCAKLAVFTGDGLNVRACTEEERAEFLADPACVEAIGAVLAEHGLTL